MQGVYIKDLDSNVSSLCDDMLTVRGDGDPQDWIEKLGNLTGLQIDCVECAATLELRSNSFAQK
jgi:hypothetical protein